MNILLVDDDEVDRLAIRRALRASGVEASIEDAVSAAQALEMLASWDQLVMMPAEQDRLEQDGEASKKRDPAPRRTKPRLVHDFSATGAAVSIIRRRRQA